LIKVNEILFLKFEKKKENPKIKKKIQIKNNLVNATRPTLLTLMNKLSKNFSNKREVWKYKGKKSDHTLWLRKDNENEKLQKIK